MYRKISVIIKHKKALYVIYGQIMNELMFFC